jgi:hypothetical protein
MDAATFEKTYTFGGTQEGCIGDKSTPTTSEPGWESAKSMAHIPYDVSADVVIKKANLI